MVYYRIFLVLILIHVVLANISGNLNRRAPREECSTPYSHNQRDVIKQALENANLNIRRRQSIPSFVFDVYFNVIAANLSYVGGWVPDSQIVSQMTVLNDGYKGTGISFKYKGTTRILSSWYFNQIDVPNTDGLEALLSGYGNIFRKGDAKTLNINLIGFSSDDEIDGFALLPSLYANYPQLDGIYVRYTTLPGGSSLYRQGSTVIHEAGHWLGLLHTFQDGCTGEGDDIADTPPEAEPASGCPIGRDTCPGGGDDPIHNFMDYSAEGCRNSFTAGQATRMRQTILVYRS